jgi:uncharacterized membrane protein
LHSPPDFILFLGRLHPLLVHLPIGMLVALATLETAALLPRFKNAAASAGFLLALAAPLAVATAVCGWFLSLAGDYDATLLGWHKWLGTVTAFGTAVAAVFFVKKKFNAYRSVLFFTAGILTVTGHLGGSLTHGSDYLGRYAPGLLKGWLGVAPAKNSSIAASKDLNTAPFFAAVIQPLLQAKCTECHGASKSKGGLQLDSFANLQRGSEDGPVLAARDAVHSPLIQRVLLPADSDDHMPPAGKPQLTATEVSLLQWWINAGASEIATASELHPSADIGRLLGLPAGR